MCCIAVASMERFAVRCFENGATMPYVFASYILPHVRVCCEFQHEQSALGRRMTYLFVLGAANAEVARNVTLVCSRVRV